MSSPLLAARPLIFQQLASCPVDIHILVIHSKVITAALAGGLRCWVCSYSPLNGQANDGQADGQTIGHWGQGVLGALDQAVAVSHQAAKQGVQVVQCICISTAHT